MSKGDGSSDLDKATADRDAALDNQHRLVQAQTAASGTSSEMSTYHRVREAGRQVRSADARVRALKAENNGAVSSRAANGGPEEDEPLLDPERFLRRTGWVCGAELASSAPARLSVDGRPVGRDPALPPGELARH
jgi:hypothetical protein